MNRRLFATGIAVFSIGVLGLGYLIGTGVVFHPADAADQYGPTEFLLIGGSFLCLTIGVVLTFRSYVEI